MEGNYKFATVEDGLKYIVGLLNSSLLNFWTENKNKRKGETIEFVGSPLSTIPIRRINFDNPEEVKLHDAIVEKVKTIRKKMMELSQYSKYFTGPRLTKLGFDEPLPELDEEAIIEALPDDRVYSIRTHPEVKVIKPSEFEDSGFRLHKIGKIVETLAGHELKLIAKDKTELILSGPRDLLELLARLLQSWKGRRWDEIKEHLLLPKTALDFEERKKEILSEVGDLRSKIATLQEEIDQIVYRLYDLTEEVE